MEKKDNYSPILTILLCLLVFPVGLVLLGANTKVKMVSKIIIAFVYTLIIVVFFTFYQPIPRKKTLPNLSGSTENIQYTINRFYKKEALINGIHETIKPGEKEIFYCVDIDVTNLGDNKVFFVSLIDDPKVETSSGYFYPDHEYSYGNEPPQAYSDWSLPKNW